MGDNGETIAGPSSAKSRWWHFRPLRTFIEKQAGVTRTRASRGVAHLYRFGFRARIAVHYRLSRHRRLRWVVSTVVLLASLGFGHWFARQSLTAYFSGEQLLSVLRTLFVTVGGALVGATAIGFSVVMIAVQLNFARIPHGLFRRLSSDLQLLGAFALTFILAVVVATLSVIPDSSWSSAASLTAVGATIAILALFLSGYRRALHLINPSVQLAMIHNSATHSMRHWVQRAERMAPLIDMPDTPASRDGTEDLGHDMRRLLFFRANPHWTNDGQEAVAYAVSFARRYSEQGDSEVAEATLNAIVAIQSFYVHAKGRTFFAPNPIFDIPEASDAFINHALEQMRQLADIALTRMDEEALRQVFRALAQLVRVYCAIDYSNKHVAEKHHARLAANYLTRAVERVLPRDNPDVLMEGVRLIGQSAQALLAAGSASEVTILTEKLGQLSCAGAIKESYRPVTLVGMEQLARVTFDLLRSKSYDIHFAVKELRGDVELVAKMFLNIPDTPLGSAHSMYLAPYFSLAQRDTFGDWLTNLTNALSEAKADDKDALRVLRHIEHWADGLYQFARDLLLAAIQKRSHFTFDILHWIAHVTKLLSTLSHAPVAETGHLKSELEKHASWLISTLSWIPDDRDATSFVEANGVTELLFEAAQDAAARKSNNLAERARELLFKWGFSAGCHRIGWAILERSLSALAALVLLSGDPNAVGWLRAEISKALAAGEAPEQDVRDQAAKGIRERARNLRSHDFEFSRIERAMQAADPQAMRTLLNEIADGLSPNTKNEPVRF
jgi:hypothetical protein